VANPEASPSCSACGGSFDASLPTAEKPGDGAPRPDSDSSIHGRFIPGTKIADRYRIVSLVGRGGMGEVYRADDLRLGHPVALKFLPSSVAEGSRGFQLFLNEVRLSRQIAHPNVCRVYDIDDVDGQQFLSMEYIDGEDLRGLLRRIGRLPSAKGIQIAQQLCAGLAAAHEKGVLHRDLKPANIMIDGRGQARITDFGLARLADSALGQGEIAGTPAYMAPEQLARGETTIQSDLYSLGLILYEVFTGQPVHKTGSFQEVLRSHQDSSQALPSTLVADLDPAVERVILRCLDKEPSQRPKSARAVAAALPGGDPLAAALAAGETPSPELVAAAGEEGALSKRVGVACLAAVTIGLGLMCWLAQRTHLVNQVGLGRHSESLADEARRIIEKLGYTEMPHDRAYGFRNEGRDTIRFWYRQSPVTMLADHYWNAWGEPSLARVNQTNPSWLVPGELGVELDPAGKLIRFRALPPLRPDRPQAQEKPAWQEWFPEELTGFDLAALEPLEDRGLRPPDAYDELQVFKVSGPAGAAKAYVQAAAYAGRPVYFEVLTPAEFEGQSPSRAMWAPFRASLSSIARQRGEGLILLLVLMVRVGAAVLAWRHFRLRRSDRKGAFRVALLVFSAGMLAWLLRANHIAGGYEVPVLQIGMAQVLEIAAGFWIVYTALEPYVRRWWPQALISWSRMVDGRWRDPLVGQNLLVGVLAGVIHRAELELEILAPGWLGLAPRSFQATDPLTLAGPTVVASEILLSTIKAAGDSLFYLMILLVFRVVLRRSWVASSAFIALLTVVAVLLAELHPVLGWFTGGLWAALVLWLLTRLGLLACIVMFVTWNLLAQFPLTTNFSAWYFGSGATAIAVVFALAAFGFHTSQAGRPIFQAEPAAR
jgi:serine/threonine-protein kinase